ncbi:MAG: response regulator, partial [Treponema sp.]|nr:response regulator [Treponema sp.]
LIILDIFMPGLSGLEVLSKLAQRQTTMPVIVYSQAIQREAVMKALQLGAKAYLVKPQKPETILAKCVEILRIEGLQDA